MKIKKHFSVVTCFLFMVSISLSAMQLPPGNYEGEDCSLTVFNDGSMIEVCDNGTGTVWSSITPIGGCAGAWSDCEASITFQ